MNHLFPRQHKQGKPPKRTFARTLKAQLRRSILTPDERFVRRLELRIANGQHRKAFRTALHAVTEARAEIVAQGVGA